MQKVMYNRPRYRVFCSVVAQHGPRLSDLARPCGSPNSITRKILYELIKSGEVCEVAHRFYVGKKGITTIARENRTHHQAMRSVITAAPVSDKGHTLIIAKRHHAVNRVHGRFIAEGYGVYEGHRMGIGKAKDPEPWFPDLWAVVHTTSNRVVLLPFLVDSSTESENSIKTTLREYRAAAWRDPESWTLHVVAKNLEAVNLFLSIGDDTNILATTLEVILKGDGYSADRVWFALRANPDLLDLDGMLLRQAL